MGEQKESLKARYQFFGACGALGGSEAVWAWFHSMFLLAVVLTAVTVYLAIRSQVLYVRYWRR